jgi:predicted dehydrogenase
VGVGTFGINHLRCFRQLGYLGVARLVAACDINEELLNRRAAEFSFRPYTDFQKMLDHEELDGITVVTPDPYHKDIVLAAAEAGVHVLSEKPLDVTVAGCQKMIDACEKAGVLLMVDFHKRYDEYHIAIKQKVNAGDLGTIQYGYCHMEDRIEVPRDWFPGWAPNSSPAWFLGIHFVDLCRFLMGGAKGTEVWASGMYGKLLGLGVDTYDAITFMVKFDNGATVVYNTAWHLPDQFEAVVNQGIRLVGTEGFFECDSQDRGTMSCCTGDKPRLQTHNKSFLRERTDKQGRQVFDGYGMESIADFALNVNALLEGATIADLGAFPGGQDGLEATRIICAVHESVLTGQVVKL